MTATLPQQQNRSNTKPPPQQARAIAPVDPTKIATLEELSSKYSPTVMAALPGLTRAITLAQGIFEMRDLVGQVWPHVRHLMGNKLGFKTDRDRDGPLYTDSVVVDVLTEALLRDVRWAGNELNIIAGGLYLTRECYERKVREIDGLTNLNLYPGIPVPHPTGAIVPFTATWSMEGKPRRMERQIPVKLNKGMGDDGALGKAERKMLASIYKRETGSEQDDEDVTAELPPPQTSNGQPATKSAAAEPEPDAAAVTEFSDLLYAARTSSYLLAIGERIKLDKRLTPKGRERLRPICTILLRGLKAKESVPGEQQLAEGEIPEGEVEGEEQPKTPLAQADEILGRLEELVGPVVVNDFLITNWCQRESLPDLGERRIGHMITALLKWETELRADGAVG